MQASGRDAPDRCPGAVQVHPAADGGLGRVRLPGGRITAAQLHTLRTAAADLGDPSLELTSRGNVQVRALPPGAETDLAARLRAAGLLPSDTHERVRNIVASPLSPAVRPLVRAFDAALCADPALAALPGRFLIAIDDGSGDVYGLLPDVALHGDRLLLAGCPTTTQATGPPNRATTGPTSTTPYPAFAVTPSPVTGGRAGVELLLDACRAFLAERAAQGSKAWRLHELTDGPARVAARLGVALTNDALRLGDCPPAGRAVQPDGRVSVTAIVPLGLLTQAHAEALEAVTQAGGEIIITPWRSVVVADVPVPEAEHVEQALSAAGLVTEPRSGWAGVTACAGRPGCNNALADVRADARAFVTRLAGAPDEPGPPNGTGPSNEPSPSNGTGPSNEPGPLDKPGPPDKPGIPEIPGTLRGLPVHWVGCERRCGAPKGLHVEMLATGTGYRVVAP